MFRMDQQGVELVDYYVILIICKDHIFIGTAGSLLFAYFQNLREITTSHFPFGKAEIAQGSRGWRAQDWGPDISVTQWVPVTFLNWNFFIWKNGDTINFLGGLWKDSIRSHNIWQCLWMNTPQNALWAPFILCANTICWSIGGSWILPPQRRKMRPICLYQTLCVAQNVWTSFLDYWIHKHRHWKHI